MQSNDTRKRPKEKKADGRFTKVYGTKYPVDLSRMGDAECIAMFGMTKSMLGRVAKKP